MTLQEFRDLLLTVTPKVYHYTAAKAAVDYIVWQETGGWAMYGNNQKQERVKTIQVELWTKTEYCPLLETLMLTLDCDEIAAAEPITDYDAGTKEIRHIIECEVV